ncbi:MAG: GNAT family N-acetyltransferase [Novosphingobium sp.]
MTDIQQADDIDRIMAIMERAFDPVFGEAWNRRQLTDALMLGNCHYGLLNARCTEPDAGEAAAGFFLSRFAYDEEELLLVAVLPGLRGLGIGESLLRRFAEQARARGAQRLLLEMRENNRAEHLYRRTGFTPIGRRPGYYSGPDGTRLDAITFELSLR